MVVVAGGGATVGARVVDANPKVGKRVRPTTIRIMV